MSLRLLFFSSSCWDKSLVASGICLLLLWFATFIERFPLWKYTGGLFSLEDDLSFKVFRIEDVGDYISLLLCVLVKNSVLLLLLFFNLWDNLHRCRIQKNRLINYWAQKWVMPTSVVLWFINDLFLMFLIACLPACLSSCLPVCLPAFLSVCLSCFTCCFTFQVCWSFRHVITTVIHWQ